MDVKNYEEIKRDILNNISSITALEGSFSDAMTSPVSIELEKSYTLLNNIYLNMFLKNLNTEDLEVKAGEEGIFRKNGTKAEGIVEIEALKDTIVEKGTLVSSALTKLNYTTTEELIFTENETKKVNIIAEEIGNKYNANINTITNLPISVVGVVSVNNKEKIIGGTNVEDDESLLERLLEHKKNNATSGNKIHYRNWAKEVEGVGDAKVISLWAGNGTVKVVVIDSNKEIANTSIVEKVQEYIDPGIEGKGEGQAPIGATTTVVSAKAKDISIRANVSVANGLRIQDVQQEFAKALETHRQERAFKDSYISYSAINNVLFNVEGVLDSNNLTLNSKKENVSLENDEIAIFKNVELEVM